MLVKGEGWDESTLLLVHSLELAESRLNMLFSFFFYYHLGFLVKADRYILCSETTHQISAWLDWLFVYCFLFLFQHR